MSVQARKARLSIGVFDSGDKLWSTAVKLLELGFAPDQIGIVSLESTFESAGRPQTISESDWARLAVIIDAVEPFVHGSGPPLLASRGLIRHLIQVDRGVSARSGPIGASGNRELGMRLDEHMLAGEIILAVASDSREQQWLSTRILLEQSNHPVQTHEFKVCPSH